jgi:hypothetical protein
VKKVKMGKRKEDRKQERLGESRIVKGMGRLSNEKRRIERQRACALNRVCRIE